MGVILTADTLKPEVVEVKFSYVATAEEIQDNDYNLNILRYLDTSEEEKEVDIAAVKKEIETWKVNCGRCKVRLRFL